MKEFELFSHTADLGVRVWGQTPEVLFQNAAQALYSLLLPQQLHRKEVQEVILEAETVEDLLIDWLNELISLFFTYGFVAGEYTIRLEPGPPYKLHAQMAGESVDLATVEITTEIKAATYHEVKIEIVEGEYCTDIIFDV